MAENLSTMDYKQYIIVELGNEQYGIDIQYIDNIVRMQRITRVPMAQSYFPFLLQFHSLLLHCCHMQ